MKCKLLKRLRKAGRNCVEIYSTTTTGNVVTGMSYGYNDDEYAGLFSFGDTFEEVKEKAAQIYLKINIDWIRNRYRKYSRKYGAKNT